MTKVQRRIPLAALKKIRARRRPICTTEEPPIRQIRPIGLLYWWLFGVVFLFYHELGIESGMHSSLGLGVSHLIEADEFAFEDDGKALTFKEYYRELFRQASGKTLINIDIDAVLGKPVHLPCDIKPIEPDDAIGLIMWFKNIKTEPIYIYDARKSRPKSAKFWSSPLNFGHRAYFVPDSEPAYLRIDKIRMEDQNTYRCRVDFRNSPTRNIKINLTIIVPPEKPIIYEPTALDKSNGVKTFNEGTDAILVCEATGGIPRPNLTWFLDNKVIDDQFEHRGEDKTFNTLVLQNVSRKYVNSRLVCAATNTNLTAPISKVLVMDINLMPTVIHITPKPRYLSAGKTYDLSCKSTGSKPAALLSWWKNGNKLKKIAKLFNEQDGESLSILTFTPEKDDNGVVLICRAENTLISGVHIEDNIRIVVHYQPMAHLSLGRTLNAEDIKEGDDVYFECIVFANPKPHKTLWYHRGKELTHNISKGVILSDSSLVLQKVHRNSSGEYTCSAINSEGKGKSNTVNLRVRYVPVCAKQGNEPEYITLQKHETFELKCEVFSSPPPKSFHWSFNKTSSHTDLPAHIITAETSVSCFNYTLLSDDDYGTVTCYAENKVGKQEIPCVFQIIAAGRPQTVKKCVVTNQSTTAMNIECSGLFETQIPHRYNLELMDMTHFRLIRNVTIDYKPVNFRVMHLDPDSTYQALIYTINAYGKSEPLVMDPITFKSFAPLTKPTEELTLLATPYIAYLAFFCLSLFLISCIVFAIIFKKIFDRRREGRAPKPESETGDADSVEDGFRVDENNAPVSQRLLQPIVSSANDVENHPTNVIVVSAVHDTGSHRSTLQSQARISPQVADEVIDIDDADPDVIPNQFERRPPKQLGQAPMFRSPSARLLQREYYPMETGNLHFGNRNILGLAGGSSYSNDAASGFGPMTGTINLPSVHGRHESVHYGFRPTKQITYATLNKNGITTCAPSAGFDSSFNNPSSSMHSSYSQPTPQAMEVTLLNPNNPSVTSSISEYRYRPEIVTTSNRIQESCI